MIFLPKLIKQNKEKLYEKDIINEKYDIKFEYYKLIESIKRTTMYYDEIMEKVYLDLNYYYEEFEY